MRIKAFEAASGLSRTTVRFYERKGLLKPKGNGGVNGYRDFDAELVDRARLIRFGQSLGFSLNEIARLLKAWDDGALDVEEQRRVLAEKRAQIREKLANLETVACYIDAKIAWIDGGCAGPAPALFACQPPLDMGQISGDDDP